MSAIDWLVWTSLDSVARGKVNYECSLGTWYPAMLSQVRWKPRGTKGSHGWVDFRMASRCPWKKPTVWVLEREKRNLLTNRIGSSWTAQNQICTIRSILFSSWSISVVFGCFGSRCPCSRFAASQTELAGAPEQYWPVDQFRMRVRQILPVSLSNVQEHVALISL